MAIIKTPQLFIDICKKNWYNEQEILSLLLIAKKVFTRYGLMMTKKEAIDAVYKEETHVGGMIAILVQLGYKTNNEIDALIKDIKRLSAQSYYTLELPKREQTSQIVDSLNKTIQNIHKQDIVIEKWLSSAGVHVYTDTHRYHRDIDTDLNTIFRH